MNDVLPGDLIEWCSHDYGLMPESETFSSIDERYCNIGTNMIHMCVAIDNVKITWINRHGIFRVFFPTTLFVRKL